MGRKVVAAEKRRRNATFSVGPDTPGMIDLLAKRHGISQGRMIDHIVSQALKGEGGPIQAPTPMCVSCGQPYVSIPRMGISHVCPTEY